MPRAEMSATPSTVAPVTTLVVLPQDDQNG
jgi:hypothetical protein